MDEALYKSFADFIDFGNGYRMLKITNKRLTAWDGLHNRARNTGIYLINRAVSPITIKSG